MCTVCICKNQKNSHHPTSYHLKSAYLGFTIFLLHHVIQINPIPQVSTPPACKAAGSLPGIRCHQMLALTQLTPPGDNVLVVFLKISQESHLKLTHSPFSV